MTEKKQNETRPFLLALTLFTAFAGSSAYTLDMHDDEAPASIQSQHSDDEHHREDNGH